jgi:hypothetical protein
LSSCLDPQGAVFLLFPHQRMPCSPFAVGTVPSETSSCRLKIFLVLGFYSEGMPCPHQWRLGIMGGHLIRIKSASQKECGLHVGSESVFCVISNWSCCCSNPIG